MGRAAARLPCTTRSARFSSSSARAATRGRSSSGRSQLDPGAAYAQNNLCYSWLMEANADAASIACRQALALEPGLVAARNNLALARAIDGDLAGAAEIFGAVGGEAAAQYNLGIVYLAQRRYAAAADAFDRAALLQPGARPGARPRAPGAPARRWTRQKAREETMSVVEVANVPVPAAPRTLEEVGPEHRPGHAAGAEDAAPRRDADRPRTGDPPGPALLGDRAEPRRAEVAAPRGDRGRLDDRRSGLQVPHHRRRARTRRPVPGAQPLRGRRAGAAGAVPPATSRASSGTTVNDVLARARPRGLQLAGAQRPRARPARAGRPRRAFAVRLRPAGKRQDRHLAVHPEPAATARSPFRTRSRSKAPSSASTIPSTTRRWRTDAAQDDDASLDRGYIAGRALGPLPAARRSRWAAS